MASLPGLLGGSTTLRGAIIKAGNRPAVLVEGAWTYRLPAPVGLEFLRRSRALPETIKAVARRAQVGQLPGSGMLRRRSGVSWLTPWPRATAQDRLAAQHVPRKLTHLRDFHSQFPDSPLQFPVRPFEFPVSAKKIPG